MWLRQVLWLFGSWVDNKKRKTRDETKENTGGVLTGGNYDDRL